MAGGLSERAEHRELPISAAHSAERVPGASANAVARQYMTRVIARLGDLYRQADSAPEPEFEVDV